MLHHVVTATPLDWSQPQVGAWTCLERCSAKSSSHTPAGRSVTCAWAWQIKASAGNMSSDRPQTMIDCTTPFCSLWEDPMPHLWMLSQEGLHLSLWGALCRWVDILMQVKKIKTMPCLLQASDQLAIWKKTTLHFQAVQLNSIKLASRSPAFNRCLTAAIWASVSSCCSVSQALDFQQRKGSCDEHIHSPSLHLSPQSWLFCPVNKGTVQTWPPNASSLVVDAPQISGKSNNIN